MFYAKQFRIKNCDQPLQLMFEKLLTWTRSRAIAIGVGIVVCCQCTPRCVAIIVRYARITQNIFIAKRKMTRIAQSKARVTCKNT